MNQEINKSEGVLQVGGDVSITNNFGLSVSQLKELVEIFMRENLPKLREEAAAEARENVQVFLREFEATLTKNLARIDVNKFKKPDVQSSINDAVMEVAKKGSQIETEILSNLVIEKLTNNSSDYVSLVASEAIKVIGKLTPEQISFLTLAVFLRHVKLTEASSLNALVPLGNQTISLASSSPLSYSQKTHLMYAGCITMNEILSNSAINIWKSTYSFLESKSEAELKAEVDSIPTLKKLNDLFDENQIGQIMLTSVGQLIGLVNLSRKVDGLNYANWLN